MNSPSRAWLMCTYRDAPSWGCNYRLKLYIDPTRFPRWVPAFPGFPSMPWRLTTPSEAHLRGVSYTLSSIPHGGFSPLPPGQGLPLLPVVPCPCRPSSTQGMGRTRGLHPRAPIVAAPAPLRARGFSVGCCSRLATWCSSPWVGDPRFYRYSTVLQARGSARRVMRLPPWQVEKD